MALKEFVYTVNQGKTDLIIGDNKNAVDLADSSGAGKSSLMEALYFLISGESIRKITNKSLINRSSESCEIFLEFYQDGDKQNLQRIDRYLTEKSQVLKLNGNALSGVAEVQKAIWAMVGVGKDVLKNFFIISDENYESFFTLSEADKETFLLQNSIYHEDLAMYEEAIKKDLKELEKRYDNSLAICDNNRKTIDRELANIKRINEFINGGDTDSVEALERLREKQAENDVALAMQRELIGVLQDKASPLKTRINNGKSIISDDTIILNKLKASLASEIVCPHCDKPFLNANKSADIDETVAQKTACEAKIAKYSNAVTILTKELQDVDKELMEAKNELTRRDRALSAIRDEIGKLSQVDDKIKEVERSKDVIKTLEGHQREIEVQLKADSDACQDLSEFYKAFVSFKNAIRNDEIAELSENMNRKIDMLSGVNLEISGTKIVKGVEKNCVNCKINGDEGGYRSLSSGEKLRVNLAFIWAKRDGYLYKGNGINLFCIDELIKAADKTVINNVFEFLSREGMTSMVISHGKTEDYDGCITKVIKDSKGSTIEQTIW